MMSGTGGKQIRTSGPLMMEQSPTCEDLHKSTSQQNNFTVSKALSESSNHPTATLVNATLQSVHNLAFAHPTKPAAAV